jgi:hypothetical protein
MGAPLSFLPHRGGGAEPPGPRQARPEDRLCEAEGEVVFQREPIARMAN